MASNVNQIIDAIVSDNEKTLNTIVAFTAKMVEWDWEVKSREVLDDYYNDHLSGNRYKNRRTNSLHNNLVVPICLNSGSSYTTGILFQSGLMHHNPLTQFNEDGIFENFMSGAHGNIPYTVPGTGEKIERNIHFTSPSPRSIFDKYYDNYDRKIDEFFEKGKALFG